MLVWSGAGDPPDGVADTEFVLGGYMAGPERSARRDAEPTGDPAAVRGRRAAGCRTSRPASRCATAAACTDGSTAELAVAGILALLRQLPKFLRRAGGRHGGRRSTPTTSTASACSSSARATSAPTSRTRSRCSAPTATYVARTARDGVHGVDELADLLPNADIVAIALPMTRRDAWPDRRGFARRVARRRDRRQRRTRRDRRHRSLARRDCRPAGCARSSTSPIRSRCRPTIRCGTSPA